MPLNACHVPDKEVWAVAGDMIAAHENLAAIETSKLADECLARGDLDGQYFWKRVVKSIVAMTDSHGQMPN